MRRQIDLRRIPPEFRPTRVASQVDRARTALPTDVQYPLRWSRNIGRSLAWTDRFRSRRRDERRTRDRWFERRCPNPLDLQRHLEGTVPCEATAGSVLRDRAPGRADCPRPAL